MTTADTPICPSCGGPATESIQVDHFTYGTQPLQASVPVLKCEKCGGSTDWRGEAIREAVVRYITS
jgi:YgiT-type zinc finger domain-containing protein